APPAPGRSRRGCVGGSCRGIGRRRRTRRRRGHQGARRGRRRLGRRRAPRALPVGRLPWWGRAYSPAGQARLSLLAVSESASGIVRVLATAVMKLASPVQRGTTWTCRCSLIDPPAGRPRLTPTFTPSGRYAALTARTASVT